MNDSSYCFSNSTHSPETTQALKVIAPLGVLICLGGLAGNGLVLGLLGYLVKWGDFTVFIFHLSLADFLYLSCQTVLFMHIVLATFHSVVFDVRYVAILINISYSAGLCVLTAISVMRCLSVLHPIWCRLHAPRHAPAVLCSLTWGLCVVLNVPHFLVCWVRKFVDCDHCYESVKIFAVFFSVLLSVTVLCTLTMLFKVRCSTQLRAPLKLHVTVLLTVLFLLFAFPLPITMYLTHRSDKSYWSVLVILLSCVNSSANPLVYYFVGKVGGRRRGKNFREVFEKALGEESVLRRGSSSGALNSSVKEPGGTGQAL